MKYNNKYGWGFGIAKRGDVGYDLFATVLPERQNLLDRLVSRFIKRPCVVLLPLVGQRVIPSGISLEIPNNLWAKIEARSSAARKKLHVLGGIIDSGYRGELYTVIHNFGFIPRVVMHGERYSQVIFNSAHRPAVKFTEEPLRESERGATGFGSTGS